MPYQEGLEEHKLSSLTDDLEEFVLVSQTENWDLKIAKDIAIFNIVFYN